jgi:NADPH:quinone reductase-like Zn-dependent oxidoreductase
VLTTVKAIRIHEYGHAHVLRYEDAPRPMPGNAEVLVPVVAAGVNPADWKLRSGVLKDIIPLPLAWIPGNDFSGIVKSVGPDITDLHDGDDVFGKSDLPTTAATRNTSS